ncbi:hypothetical protein, partial [Mesorhizobium sp. M8A.F.Ca.ET.142.01.1.1]|uniref:hypothetical protein n=1 Tax=Mesorhizobium sp. M8A.F.Ca.ET.142.01.1.1 TaxID=2563958 RepID=UPI001673FDA2
DAGQTKSVIGSLLLHGGVDLPRYIVTARLVRVVKPDKIECQPEQKDAQTWDCRSHLKKVADLYICETVLVARKFQCARSDQKDATEDQNAPS